MRRRRFLVIAIMAAVQIVHAQMLIKNSSLGELVRITHNGSVGIGTSTPAATMAVAGNMALGSTYATLTPPDNGLIVQGLLGIGTALNNPNAQATVIGSIVDAGDALRRTLLVRAEDFNINSQSQVTIAAHSHAPAQNSDNMFRTAVYGAVTSDYGGDNINVVASANMAHYVGSGNTSPTQYYGVNAMIHAQDVSWNPIAKTATRVALLGVNYNNSANDWSLRALGAKSYIANELYVNTQNINSDYALSVGGEARKSAGTASWVIFSDKRLKNISGNYDPGLAEIMQLQAIRFKYIAKSNLGLSTDAEYVGLGAQDVQKVIPEAVTRDDSGYLMLKTDPIFYAMLNAIKELKEKNDRLQSRLELLEAIR